ncbi:MAG: DUF6062 family protein [Chloroflexota bacterium]
MKDWLRRRLGFQKHTPYYELLETLTEHEGCPVCHMASRGTDRYLGMMSYENVTDVSTRDELRAAWGLCNFHAWQFLGRGGERLATAIIYRDLVETALRRLEGNGGGLVRELAPQGECLACRYLAESSRRHVDTLLAYLEDDQLRERYEASRGLCLPHLREALGRVDAPDQREVLLAVFSRQIAAFAASLADAADAPIAGLVAGLAGGHGTALGTNPSPEQPADLPAAPRPTLVALREALAEEACPICRGITAATDGYLASLPSAVGDDPGLSANLSEARGLCNNHSWRLIEIAGKDRLADIWRPPLAALRESLDSLGETEDRGPQGPLGLLLGPRRARQAGAAAEAALAPRAPCPACRYQVGVERVWVEALLEALKGEAFAAEYGRSPGLCRPHLRGALALAGERRQVAALVSCQAEAFRGLSADLAEYVRKFDYRFCREPMGGEVDSPERGIAAMVGLPGTWGVGRT